MVLYFLILKQSIVQGFNTLDEDRAKFIVLSEKNVKEPYIVTQKHRQSRSPVPNFARMARISHPMVMILIIVCFMARKKDRTPLNARLFLLNKLKDMTLLSARLFLLDKL